MSSFQGEIGIIGLGAMGRNLLLNIADHDILVIGLDQDKAKVDLVLKDGNGNSRIQATQDVTQFLARLRRPRAILLLVPAGSPVDEVIKELTPRLEREDLVIDAGNSHYKDTDVREKTLASSGVYFFGMGISGGESGARHGPSIMPSGEKAAYERVRSTLEAIAAHVKNEPCVTYLGPKSAGHYVKMVHNGIEYGLMQLIAESYALMKVGLNLSNDECHDTYQKWNQSELNSYLLEITANIFLKKDQQTDQRLLDMILGVANQNGTGKWTCQDAMDLQIPIPTIDAAVSMRDLSSLSADRARLSKNIKKSDFKKQDEKKPDLNQLSNAYYASQIITFAQGMAQLKKAKDTYHYQFKLESVARIWRGGCIIRAALLELIMSAYQSSPELDCLLLDPHLGEEIEKRQTDLRSVVAWAVSLGQPVPALMASLAYYDSYCSTWLPTNLIQAQRDYFGAHTYQRVDEKGSFHTNWESQPSNK